MGAPYNDPRLLSEHAIKINPLSRYLRRAESVCCVEIYRRILKIESLEEKKNWKGMFVLWKKFVRGFLLFRILMRYVRVNIRIIIK